LGKGLRGLLGKISPGAAFDEPVLVFARESVAIGEGVRVWCTIGISFEGDRRDGNDRTFGKPLFRVVVFRLAFARSSRQR
jgi:hypothetical protein